MRLYVSGPITGYQDLNKPLFAAVTMSLRNAGHQVLNPHDVCTLLKEHECEQPCHPSEELLPWADYLRADLVAMLQQADAVAVLPAWELSKGAALEVGVAQALGWEVKPWEQWL